MQNDLVRKEKELKLIYLDEAGNTGSRADPDQPIHMIGSLIVDQSQIRDVERQLNAVAESASEAMKSGGVRLPSENLEFHGTDLFNGKKAFEGINPQIRIDICEKIVEVCSASSLLFGHCAIDKLKLAGGHPHMRCFQFTLERLQDYLSKNNELGLIVADEHRELEEEIIKDLAFSKTVSTGWGYRPTMIKNIVDTVHFVKSKHNRLVQACDVLTYFRLKGLRIHIRLLDEWTKSNEHGPTISFTDFKQKTLRVADKAALDLCDRIITFEKFDKLWPTS